MPHTIKKKFLFFVLIFLPAIAQAQDTQVRKYININENWLFAKDINKKGYQTLKFTRVNLPHTWNAFDVIDDEPGYYRGEGYYKKKLVLNSSWKNKHISLQFAAANQETWV